MEGKLSKKLLAIGAVLCALAFVGVGFSAWYMSGTTQYSFGGNVTVEDIIGSNASVTIGSGQGDQSVIYGAPDDAVNASTWLYSDGLSTENLTLEYDFTFDGVTAASAFALTVTASDSNAGGIQYTSQFGSSYNKTASYLMAVNNGYIASAEDVAITYTSSGVNSGISYDTSTKTFKFTGDLSTCTAHVTFKFSWGSSFDGENPYYTYKDLTDEDARIKAADTLAYIAACLSGVSYSIVFTPVSNV